MTVSYDQAFAFPASFRDNQEPLRCCCVGGAGGNPQLYFRACIHFAPHRQLTSDQCGAFPHTRQAIVPLTC